MERPNRVSAMFLAGSGGDVDPPIFLDNFNGAAGSMVGTTADTGETRTFVVGYGTFLLSGDGNCYMDGDSPNTAHLRWSGVSVPDGSTIKVTLSTEEGQSDYFFFNADFGAAGSGWAVYLAPEDDQLLLVRYSTLIPGLSATADTDELSIPGAAVGTPIEVTITLDGDNITFGALGFSKVYTKLNRDYKNNTDICIIGLNYDDTRRNYKVEVV